MFYNYIQHKKYYKNQAITPTNNYDNKAPFNLKSLEFVDKYNPIKV